ncbi:MAG: GrpB family protein [Victivallaceae bacterium]|nr:GrpB family protein [Victivallaceae bacterium]
MRQESLEEKIKRVTAEGVEVVKYNPGWPKLFEQEKEHLQQCLPVDLIVRIEHFGSTAVRGLAAKPIVDMLIEITNVQRGKTLIPEVLEPQGYDCFWRPLWNENVPPFFTWCIKRNASGIRTHHLHFVAVGFKDEELRFRDILRQNQDIATAYADLKFKLSADHHADRISYTEAKGDFIRQILENN